MNVVFREYRGRSTNELEIKEEAKASRTTYYPVWVVYFVCALSNRAEFQYACKTEKIAKMITEIECCPYHAWKPEYVEIAKQEGTSYWLIRKEYEVCPDFYHSSSECPYDFYGHSACPAYKNIHEIEDRLNKKKENENG